MAPFIWEAAGTAAGKDSAIKGMGMGYAGLTSKVKDEETGRKRG
jgi:hypothetical protein